MITIPKPTFYPGVPITCMIYHSNRNNRESSFPKKFQSWLPLVVRYSRMNIGFMREYTEMKDTNFFSDLKLEGNFVGSLL